MSRSFLPPPPLSATVPEPPPGLRQVSSRAFNRDRLLSADPTLMPTTEDKARAAHNPYRVRGAYAMLSPSFR